MSNKMLLIESFTKAEFKIGIENPIINSLNNLKWDLGYIIIIMSNYHCEQRWLCGTVVGYHECQLEYVTP